jgi:hypothetical protein
VAIRLCFGNRVVSDITSPEIDGIYVSDPSRYRMAAFFQGGLNNKAFAKIINGGPSLSDLTATPTGAFTADVTADCRTVEGTLYGVVTNSATKPTAQQVKEGKNHLGTTVPSASKTVEEGTETLSITSDTDNVLRHIHLVQHDPSLNAGAVSTTTVTFPAVSQVTATWLSDANENQFGATSAQTNSTISVGASAPSGKKVMAVIVAYSTATATLTASSPYYFSSSYVYVDIVDQVTVVTAGGQSMNICILEMDMTTETSAYIGATYSGGCSRWSVDLFLVEDYGAGALVAYENSTTSGTSIAVSPTIPTKGLAMVVAAANTATGVTWSADTDEVASTDEAVFSGSNRKAIALNDTAGSGAITASIPDAATAMAILAVVIPAETPP